MKTINRNSYKKAMHGKYLLFKTDTNPIILQHRNIKQTKN